MGLLYELGDSSTDEFIAECGVRSWGPVGGGSPGQDLEKYILVLSSSFIFLLPSHHGVSSFLPPCSADVQFLPWLQQTMRALKPWAKIYLLFYIAGVGYFDPAVKNRMMHLLVLCFSSLRNFQGFYNDHTILPCHPQCMNSSCSGSSAVLVILIMIITITKTIVGPKGYVPVPVTCIYHYIFVKIALLLFSNLEVCFLYQRLKSWPSTCLASACTDELNPQPPTWKSLIF